MAEYPDIIRIAQTILDQQKVINEQKARIAELEGPMPADRPDSDIAWEQVWADQYDLCRVLGDRITKLTEGKSLAYGAALTAYLIEHLAERQRMFLRLPESDVQVTTPEPEPQPGGTDA